MDKTVTLEIMGRKQTFNAKTEYIFSHYSETDTNHDIFDGIDGVYEVSYAEYFNIDGVILDGYEEMVEKGIRTNSLSAILDYLIKKGWRIEYKVINLHKFDCDKGNFEE